MLLSMTGYGEAFREQGGLSVAVEVRTVNSRYFKLLVRCNEGCGALESKIEAFVRKSIRRATVQVTLRVDRVKSPDDYRINTDVLSGYRKQLEDWSGGGASEPVGLLGQALQPRGVLRQLAQRGIFRRERVDPALQPVDPARQFPGYASIAEHACDGTAARQYRHR